MYAINRATPVRPNEQVEVEHIFTEDSSIVYQLFLCTKEALQGKTYQKPRDNPKANRKASTSP